MSTQSVADNFAQAVKCTTAYKKDIGCIDLDKFLIRMLSSALGRNVRNSSFDDLQKSLLNALARNVAGYRAVFALARNLINLIDINNSALGFFYVEISCLNKAKQNILYVLADIARFCKGCGIGNGKRNVKHPCKRLRKKGFSYAGRTEEENVAFAQLYLIGIALSLFNQRVNALVVVINSNRKRNLCVILTDNVFVKLCLYLGRLGKRDYICIGLCNSRLFDHDMIIINVGDLTAKIYAIIAKINMVTLNGQGCKIRRGSAAETTDLNFICHKVN